MVKIDSIKHSLDKHESDIPPIEIGNVLTFFLEKRQLAVVLARGKCKPQFQNNHDNNTYAVLPKLLAIKKAMKTTQLDQKSCDYLFRLEKKFVLRGVVHSHYNHDMVATTDDAFIPDIYSLLALIFMELFQQNKDLNALNSSIRLIDKCCELIAQGHDVLSEDELEECINMEAKILNGLLNDK